MDIYLPPSTIAETIGVGEDIIKRTLERRDKEIEPYLRVVSAPSDEVGGAPKPQIQLRVDGLSPLIKKLTYNIPTDDIIENLSCQIVHIAYLQETGENLETHNEALVAENKQLRETIESIQAEKADLQARVNNLTEQLKAEKSRTWTDRLFHRRN